MENRENTLTCLEFKRIINNGSENDVSLFGAFPSDSEVKFIISVPRLEAVLDAKMTVESDEGVRTYYRTDFCGIEKNRDTFCVKLKMREVLSDAGEKASGLFFYVWEITCLTGTRFFGGESVKKLKEFKTAKDARRQLLIFSPERNTSDLLYGGIVYQIFPDRFRKSGKCRFKEGTVEKKWDEKPSYPEYPGAPHLNNDFFGGDLYGIKDKLDYLHSLGVSAIYLNPIFESSSNHRYDTGDMLKTDDAVGGDEALRSLIDSANDMGIKIILDGVFNHTGSDSVYFNKKGKYGKSGAYRSKESEYYSWYFFDEYPDKYRSWWGVDTLPKVNCDYGSYRAYIKDVFLPKWMSFGIGGWRIDVADELSDSFLVFLRENVKKITPNAVLIGEVWEDASNKISYGKRRKYLYGEELDGVMNYPLRNALISYMLYGDTERIRNATEGLYRRYPKHASDSSFNLVGSHDTVRILTALGGVSDEGKTNSEKSGFRMPEQNRKLAKRRLKAVYSVLYSLPGVPVIYYGDEAGCEGYGDPFCRGTYPWGNEDRELVDHLIKEGMLRRKEPLLERGLFEIVYLDPDVFAFLRTPCKFGEEALITVLNRSDKPVEINLPDGSFELDPISVMKKKVQASDAEKMTAYYG